MNRKEKKKKKKKTYFTADVLRADALACVLCADADEQKGKRKKKKLTLMRMVGQRMCCVWTRMAVNADGGGQ